MNDPTGSILLKNSLSVQKRFSSFMEIQPKIWGKHNARLNEKDWAVIVKSGRSLESRKFPAFYGATIFLPNTP